MVFDKLKQVNSWTFDETLNIQTTTPAVRFQAEVPYVSDSENDWFILARTESFPQDKPVMASIPGDFLQIGVYNARRSAGLRFVLTKVMIPLVMTHVPLSTIYIVSLFILLSFTCMSEKQGNEDCQPNQCKLVNRWTP